MLLKCLEGEGWNDSKLKSKKKIDTSSLQLYYVGRRSGRLGMLVQDTSPPLFVVKKNKHVCHDIIISLDGLLLIGINLISATCQADVSLGVSSFQA